MNARAFCFLIVDDHPLVRNSLRAGLCSAFPAAIVSEAGNTAEALAAIAVRVPALVLVDVNLPGQNGIDLTRRILAADKRIRLLVISGEADPWTVREALDAGASGFVTKTRPIQFFTQAVKDILKGKKVLCPEAQAAIRGRGGCGGPVKEPPGPAVLSRREREILNYIAHGENTKAIALQLQISPKTVETHRQHLMRKLGIDSVVLLSQYARHHKIGPV